MPTNLHAIMQGLYSIESGLQSMSEGVRAIIAAVSSNYWNPADKGAGVVLSNSDKTAADATETGDSVRSVTFHGSGKYYFEMSLDVDDGASLGLANSSELMSGGGGLGESADSLRIGSEEIIENATGTPYATPVSQGDIVGFAVDTTSKLLYVAVNGTWQESADPAAGTGGYNYAITGDIYAATGPYLSEITLRTADADFTYTPPTGFTAWG